MINEIDSSAATPLQAVKLLALYLASPGNKVTVCFPPFRSILDWIDLLTLSILCEFTCTYPIGAVGIKFYNVNI